MSICLRHWKHLYSWDRINQTIYIPSKNTGKNITLKQMFDISEKLIVEQSDEVFGVSQISCENSPWKQLSLGNDEEVISLSYAKVYVFSDSVLCPGKVNQNPTSKNVWEEKFSWFKVSPQYRILDRIDGESMEFEWIFPGFTTLQLCSKVQELLLRLSVPPEKFTGRIIFMSMFNDISRRVKDNELECIANATLASFLQKKDFQQDVGHSSDLDQIRNGILLANTNHKESGTELLSK